MTDVMSQVSSLFNAVYCVGNWINYIAGEDKLTIIFIL